MEKEQNLAPQGDYYIENLPTGIRGWVFTLGKYNEDVEVPIRILQRYLEVPETGHYDKETCLKLENMLQYKDIGEVLSDLARVPQNNGAKYLSSQFETKIEFVPQETLRDMVTLFNKENYGDLISWKKKK